MLVHGLRLLVALVTFAAGVAASWLLGSDRPAKMERRGVADTTVVSVLTTTPDEPPPPPRVACRANLRQRVVAGGVLNVKAVSRPAPVYPPAARAAGVSGTVAVQVEVDEDGDVASAEAVSGPLLLRGAAEEAARGARFSPTLLSGEPVRVSGVVTYNFWPR
ncbi:MAG TPA: energy transducer TonB [Pyrinomonadaceae bacterium]|jgi:protein TonB